MKKLHIAGICVALILAVYCTIIAVLDTRTLIVSVYILVCSFRAALLVAFLVLYVALLRHIRAKMSRHETLLASRATTESEAEDIGMFRKQVHVFFIVMIICSIMHLNEVIVMSVADAKRANGDIMLHEKLVFASNILSMIANVIFSIVVICLLTKNEETTLTDNLVDSPQPVANEQ